jgi:cyclopropane fatty-acyl-phospholipid synthase-like methyltransferase
VNGGSNVPDDFYWAFEERMRGSSAAIRERLGTYEGFARDLHASFVGNGTDAPRWLDLGCGRGEFCELLADWGWRSEGVDRSPSAVEASQRRGLTVALSDVFTYLEEVPAEDAEAVSAIQLIEHLPRERWLPLFEAILGVLRPGGAVLVETINGRNLRALADHFIADLTHTWPGHPETLRLLAEHAGFVDVEIRFEHPDAHGAAEDVAIWARKPQS